MVTHAHMHTRQPTITLAAHAHRGLMSAIAERNCNFSVQVQAVTHLGLGSFSAPVNVTVEGHSDSTSSDNTGAIVAGVIAAIIGILLLVCIIW